MDRCAWRVVGSEAWMDALNWLTVSQNNYLSLAFVWSWGSRGSWVTVGLVWPDNWGDVATQHDLLG